MMQKAITHSGLVNVTSFGVVDEETFIAAVLISTVDQRFVKFYNVIHQVSLECLNVWFEFFTDDKFLPG